MFELMCTFLPACVCVCVCLCVCIGVSPVLVLPYIYSPHSYYCMYMLNCLNSKQLSFNIHILTITTLLVFSVHCTPMK